MISTILKPVDLSKQRVSYILFPKQRGFLPAEQAFKHKILDELRNHNLIELEYFSLQRNQNLWLFVVTKDGVQFVVTKDSE